jgi:regulator of protease activity HflC (stomatin/prohibitin superfamily)
MESALLATGAAVGAVGAYGASVAAKDNPSTSSLRFTIEELQKQINKLKEAQDACCKAEAVAAAVAAPAPAPVEPVAAPAEPVAAAVAAPAPAPVAVPVSLAGVPAAPETTGDLLDLSGLASAPAPAPAPASDLFDLFSTPARAAVPVSLAGLPSAPPQEPELPGTSQLVSVSPQESELPGTSQLVSAPRLEARAPVQGDRIARNLFDRDVTEKMNIILPAAKAVFEKAKSIDSLSPLTASSPAYPPIRKKPTKGGLWPFTSKPVPAPEPVPVFTVIDEEDLLLQQRLLRSRIPELRKLIDENTSTFAEYTNAPTLDARIPYVATLKANLDAMASKTKEVESNIKLLEELSAKKSAYESLKQTEKAEQQRAEAAAKTEQQRAEAAAVAAQAKREYQSTSIQDTLEEKSEAALAWYTDMIDYFSTNISRRLNELQTNYAPDDKSILDKYVETKQWFDVVVGSPPIDKDYLGEGKMGLQKAYDDFKAAAGTQKSGILGITRKTKKYLNKEYKGNPSKPVPSIPYYPPKRRGGTRKRKRGGALQKLIDLKARIEAQLDYYNRVKPDVEAFREEADRFINAKAEEYPKTVTETMQDRNRESEALRREFIREAKKKEKEAATTSSAVPFQPSTNGTFGINNPVQLFTPKPKKPSATTPPVPGPPSSPPPPLLAPSSSLTLSPAGTGLLSVAQIRANDIAAETEARKRAEAEAEAAKQSVPFGQQPLTSDLKNIKRPGFSASTTPTASVPGDSTSGETIQEQLTRLQTLGQQNPLRVGGPLYTTGGLRKKKLRSRRGGKQKKNVRRTRRS